MNFLKKLFSKKEPEIQKAKTLIEESSPSCPLVALVEQDNRVAYLYICGSEDSSFGVKSCWIRNLKQAPDEVELDLLENGIAPMLAKSNCKFPEGQEALDVANLELVWLEEGEGVALLENNEIIAVIPSWGGQGGFHGYARDCVGHGDFAWELGTDNGMLERIHKSRTFWESWNQEESPWHLWQPQLLGCYEAQFGEIDKYYPIDGEEWPPKGLYYKKQSGKNIFVTVGVSLRSQPMVEMYTDEPNMMNRIELGFITTADLKDTEVEHMVRWIRKQADLPWGQITWLGEGHTIYCDVFDNTKFDAVVLTSKLDVLPKFDLPEIYGSKVNLFWLVPITEREKNYVVDYGSQGLIDALDRVGDRIYSFARKEIRL